jgi:hypothetical protein
MAEEMRFRWALPVSQAADEQSLLKQAGARLDAPQKFVPPSDERDLYMHPGFEPLTVLLGVIAIDYLVQRIEDRIRDRHRRGIVIDAMGDEVEIRPTPALDPGEVLVLTKSGAQQFDFSRRVDAIALIRAVLGQKK